MGDRNDSVQLPDGWVWKQVQDVSRVIPIARNKIKKKNYVENGRIPVVDQGQGLVGGFTNQEDLAVDVELPVVVFGDHTRAIKYIDFRFVAGADGIKVLKPVPEFHPKLFYHFLRLLKLPDKGYSRHYKFLKKSYLPLPPESQQQKISAILDVTSSGIEKAKGELSRIPDLTRRLQMAILSKAFRGELTERAPDDEPAEVLLERIQRERAATTRKSLPRRAVFKRGSQKGVLEPHNLPNGWLWTTVGNLILESRYGTSVKCSANTKGIPVLRIPNVVKGLNFQELKYAKPQEIDLDKLRIQNGDILVVRTNGSLSLVGRSSVARGMRKDYAFASYLIRLRLPALDFLSEYVALAMKSDFGRRAIESRAKTTAGQYNVNTEILLSIPVPLPTSREIEPIVKICRAAFSLCSLLEMNAEAAMEQIGSLEARILNQVFQGRRKAWAGDSIG